MNIVASTFGSAQWPEMVPHARALADVLRSELTILFMESGRSGISATTEDGPGAAGIIGTIHAIDPGASVQAMPAPANDGAGIVSQIALATGASVVAMHTPTGRPFQQALTGGSAGKVLEGASVPLLLGSTALEPPRMPYRLLIAVDDSDQAERTVQAVADLLPEPPSRIGLVTTYFDTLGDGHPREESIARRKRLEELAERLPRTSEVDLLIETAGGLETVQSQVLAAAERWQASAIVVARQHRGRIQQALEGSTSLAILRKSPVPLLFAPPYGPPRSPKRGVRSEIDVSGLLQGAAQQNVGARP